MPCCRREFAPSLHFLKAPSFLQKGKHQTNQPWTPMQTTSALMSTLAPQVPATIFLMISIKWGIAFLQNVHLFNLHFQNSQAPQKRSILALQVLATIFLMTSFQWDIAFLQNVQLYNNHQTLSHLICQERELRSHFQDMLGLPQRNPRLKPTMSPTSRWKVLRSTRQTSKRGSRRC